MTVVFCLYIDSPGLEKRPMYMYSSPRQVDFLAGQVTFKAWLMPLFYLHINKAEINAL